MLIWYEIHFMLVFTSHLHNNESAKGPNLQRWHNGKFAEVPRIYYLFFGKKVLVSDRILFTPAKMHFFPCFNSFWTTKG